eukprot:230624-Prymnesium_polylepis.1
MARPPAQATPVGSPATLLAATWADRRSRRREAANALVQGRARARAAPRWGHGCMGLGSRLMSSLAHF